MLSNITKFFFQVTMQRFKQNLIQMPLWPSDLHERNVKSLYNNKEITKNENKILS